MSVIPCQKRSILFQSLGSRPELDRKFDAEQMYSSLMDSPSTNSKIKIFLDSASTDEILNYYRSSRDYIQGFTTNPTLMKNSGVKEYKEFIREILSEITDMPISFEVFADDLEEMKRQALTLAGFGENVYVKIPVTNTKGVSTHRVSIRTHQRGRDL